MTGITENMGGAARFDVAAVLGASFDEVTKAPVVTYDFECYDKDGNLKWQESIKNLVTDVGRKDVLDKYFAGSAYTATWYVGLIDNASFTALAAADTQASHAGWLEAVPYSNANRLTVAWNAATGTTTASKAASTFVEFTINATAVIKGAFLSSNNTKSGTTGILYSESAFGATRSVVNGDFVRVTPTMSMT